MEEALEELRVQMTAGGEISEGSGSDGSWEEVDGVAELQVAGSKAKPGSRKGDGPLIEDYVESDVEEVFEQIAGRLGGGGGGGVPGATQKVDVKYTQVSLHRESSSIRTY